MTPMARPDTIIIAAAARSIIENASHLPRSPGPEALLEALIEGGLSAAVELLGPSEAYEIAQKVLDRYLAEFVEARRRAELQGN